jgi:hypothetical protein
MEVQISTNFNEFYRSTSEHLVNIRVEECFDKVLYHVNSKNVKVQNEECHYYAKNAIWKITNL